MSVIIAFIGRKDISFFYFLNRRMHCRLLDIFMKSVTSLGSTAFALLVTLAFLMASRKTGLILMINLTLSQIGIQALKRLVNRPRPYLTYNWVLSLKPPKCKYSFPSGHSCSALSIALTISYFIPGSAAVLIPIAATVGLSRIYLGCHYPTDVSVGFFVSLFVYKASEFMILF